MRKHLFVICSLLCLQAAQAQGLKFKGNSSPIAERTSYMVFSNPVPAFTDQLHVGFDLLVNEGQTGYILRIKDEACSKTYNFSYDQVQNQLILKISEEGKNNLITASLDWNLVNKQKWQKVVLAFDLKQDSLHFTFNQEKYQAGGLELPEKWVPKIYFGRSEHIVDVPAFAIKNLLVRDGKQEYSFPLQEVSGTEVHNGQGKVIGWVDNPTWLINDYYYWSFRKQFESSSVACANYNNRTQEVLFLNQDSLWMYNVKSGSASSMGYPGTSPTPFDLGANFIDPAQNCLYAYDPYAESGQGKIACLDLSAYTWRNDTTPPFDRQIHHHAAYFDEAANRYILFGGFGNRRYSNDFFSYSPATNKWERLTFTGDSIFPRYFVSMGHNPVNRMLYIFGGMGNESGDQYVGRRYLYDLYQVDLEKRTIKKLWEIPWDQEDVVPVRGMVMVDDVFFYTLCYPESVSDSQLKLYRFSLKDGSYQAMGDSIPIRSDKIKTNANLYYDAAMEELCALVQVFDNEDKGSVLKVYTLSFPPVTKEGLNAMEKLTHRGGMAAVWWGGGILLAGMAAGLYIIRRRKKRPGQPASVPDEPIMASADEPVAAPVFVAGHLPEDRSNAVYLFGEFTVKDRQGRDISYMFSTRSRQLFAVILYASSRDGLTSQQLNEMFWPDKSEEKVKNSRGVALNHLRKSLTELDGVALVFEKKLFRIVFEKECYCDYIDYIRIINENNPKRNRDDFQRIIARGKFLRSLDTPLLDPFKEYVEYTVEAALTLEIHQSFVDQHYQATIVMAEALFHIDPVNEVALRHLIQALVKMKRQEDAKKRYLLFAVEYKKDLGEEYPKSFSELLN